MKTPLIRIAILHDGSTLNKSSAYEFKDLLEKTFKYDYNPKPVVDTKLTDEMKTCHVLFVMVDDKTLKDEVPEVYQEANDYFYSKNKDTIVIFTEPIDSKNYDKFNENILDAYYFKAYNFIDTIKHYLKLFDRLFPHFFSSDEYMLAMDEFYNPNVEIDYKKIEKILKSTKDNKGYLEAIDTLAALYEGEWFFPLDTVKSLRYRLEICKTNAKELKDIRNMDYYSCRNAINNIINLINSQLRYGSSLSDKDYEKYFKLANEYCDFLIKTYDKYGKEFERAKHYLSLLDYIRNSYNPEYKTRFNLSDELRYYMHNKNIIFDRNYGTKGFIAVANLVSNNFKDNREMIYPVADYLYQNRSIIPEFNKVLYSFLSKLYNYISYQRCDLETNPHKYFVEQCKLLEFFKAMESMFGFRTAMFNSLMRNLYKFVESIRDQEVDFALLNIKAMTSSYYEKNEESYNYVQKILKEQQEAIIRQLPIIFDEINKEFNNKKYRKTDALISEFICLVTKCENKEIKDIYSKKLEETRKISYEIRKILFSN